MRKLNERLLNEKFGDIPKWLSNRLNAVKTVSKTGNINSKFSNNEYGSESNPTYQSKWHKSHPGVNSLYDQIEAQGYDFANMSAQEMEMPNTKGKIKKLATNDTFPTFLLRDPDTGKTQVYIMGINDYELAIPKKDEPWRLDWLPINDLKNYTVKFALLKMPIKDPSLMDKRQEWGNEASGISGKQRNKGFAGFQTSDGSLDFDKSGYNAGPAKERLRKGADDLKIEKEKLRKDLTNILGAIPKVEDELEDTQENIEEEIPEEESVIDREVNKVKESLRRLEHRIKTCMFELDSISDEEFSIVFSTNRNRISIHYLAQEFMKIKGHIQEFEQDLIGVDEYIETELSNNENYHGIIESWDDVDMECLLRTKDLVSNKTGEVVESNIIDYIPLFIQSEINEIDRVLSNQFLQELDWD